jgi:hypothetical protein
MLFAICDLASTDYQFVVCSTNTLISTQQICIVATTPRSNQEELGVSRNLTALPSRAEYWAETLTVRSVNAAEAPQF